MLTASGHPGSYGWRDSATIWPIRRYLARLAPTGACVTNLYQNARRLHGDLARGQLWAISYKGGRGALLTTGTRVVAASRHHPPFLRIFSPALAVRRVRSIFRRYPRQASPEQDFTGRDIPYQGILLAVKSVFIR